MIQSLQQELSEGQDQLKNQEITFQRIVNEKESSSQAMGDELVKLRMENQSLRLVQINLEGEH